MVSTWALAQSETETTRGHCGGNILSVPPLRYKYGARARAEAGRPGYLSGEKWKCLDHCGSRKGGAGLDSGYILKVESMQFPSGLHVGCEGKRGVNSDCRVSCPKPQDEVYNKPLANIRKAM